MNDTSIIRQCDDKPRVNVTVHIKPVDYSNATLMTSVLPRSHKSARRTTFNWNDFRLINKLILIIINLKLLLS